MRKKHQCQHEIDRLGNVCDGCGCALEPMETVDNSGNPAFWPGCKQCGVFTWGCKSPVFEIAKKLVCDLGFNYYPDGNERSNIVKAVMIITLIKAIELNPAPDSY